jgi:DNA replication and repair protein RecF
MWLRALNVDRLRNLKSVDVKLTAGLTLVTGRNGHGKTSLLEAAYLLGTAHSFRTRKLDELVGWQGGPLRVSGEVAGLAMENRLSLVVDQGVRRLFVDGAERNLQVFLGKLDLVALPNETMRILRDGPEGRRRFVDSGVAGLHPAFLNDLGSYRRVLAERNALLRRGGGGEGRVPETHEMEAWEDRLAAASSRIHRQRREYIVRMASRMGPAERWLFPDGEAIRVRYLPSPAAIGESDPSQLEARFRDALVSTRRRDKSFGFTTDGPHRDDLEVTLEGVDLRRFGSAGQLRATMIALCAGKLGLLRDERREAPLFLMDDFDSDLDEGRTRSLVDFLRDGGFQSLMATSKDGFVDRLGVPFHRIQMEGGMARAA